MADQTPAAKPADDLNMAIERGCLSPMAKAAMEASRDELRRLDERERELVFALKMAEAVIDRSSVNTLRTVRAALANGGG